MTLQEAIKMMLANSELWIRPVSAKGCCYAYTFEGHNIVQVPSSRGGIPRMTTYIKELTGDWEVVHPDAVLNGK